MVGIRTAISLWIKACRGTLPTVVLHEDTRCSLCNGPFDAGAIARPAFTVGSGPIVLHGNNVECIAHLRASVVDRDEVSKLLTTPLPRPDGT